jgi:hypothetical protein
MSAMPRSSAVFSRVVVGPTDTRSRVFGTLLGIGLRRRVITGVGLRSRCRCLLRLRQRENVRLDVDPGVQLDHLGEGAPVRDPVTSLDLPQLGVVPVEEPVAVAERLELLPPDGELQLPELDAGKMLLREHAHEGVE